MTAAQDTIWRAEPGGGAKRCRLHNAVRCCYADTACDRPFPHTCALVEAAWVDQCYDALDALRTRDGDCSGVIPEHWEA